MEKQTPGLKFPQNIVLASRSPRRKQLLESLGLKFSVASSDVEEIWPEGLNPEEIAEYLAEIKAKAVLNHFDDHLIISADTIVVDDMKILGKPSGHEEAFEMIRSLSGKDHDVITGVCLMDKTKTKCISSTTQVTFKDLSDEEIEYYIHHYEPFDKAGAYGIQEWIGMIGVTGMKGSYFNVMGLPVHEVYKALIEW